MYTLKGTKTWLHFLSLFMELSKSEKHKKGFLQMLSSGKRCLFFTITADILFKS